MTKQLIIQGRTYKDPQWIQVDVAQDEEDAKRILQARIKAFQDVGRFYKGRLNDVHKNQIDIIERQVVVQSYRAVWRKVDGKTR